MWGAAWWGGSERFALPGGGEAPWGRGAGATSWLRRRLRRPGRAVPHTGGHGDGGGVLHAHPSHGNDAIAAVPMPGAQGRAVNPVPPTAGRGQAAERAETQPRAARAPRVGAAAVIWVKSSPKGDWA